jgi:hypothetical protein
MEMRRAEPSKSSLLDSLSTIRAAKTKFHLLTGGNLTPTGLVTQIRLCDVLLGEIRAISRGLESRMGSGDMISQRAVVARRDRGSRHVAVQQGNPENRSRQRR